MLRSARFITAHYVSHFRRDCRGRFLNCQKICHGVHGYPGVLRLPIPFPCVASRLSRFAHGCLKRGRRDRREHSVNAVLRIIPAVPLSIMVVCAAKLSPSKINIDCFIFETSTRDTCIQSHCHSCRFPRFLTLSVIRVNSRIYISLPCLILLFFLFLRRPPTINAGLSASVKFTLFNAFWSFSLKVVCIVRPTGLEVRLLL